MDSCLNAYEAVKVSELNCDTLKKCDSFSYDHKRLMPSSKICSIKKENVNDYRKSLLAEDINLIQIQQAKLDEKYKVVDEKYKVVEKTVESEELSMTVSTQSNVQLEGKEVYHEYNDKKPVKSLVKTVVNRVKMNKYSNGNGKHQEDIQDYQTLRQSHDSENAMFNSIGYYIYGGDQVIFSKVHEPADQV